jgi:hypothetical protein
LVVIVIFVDCANTAFSNKRNECKSAAQLREDIDRSSDHGIQQSVEKVFTSAGHDIGTIARDHHN